ncbi:MAG: sigma-70 family RNA polymerase sigma factor [Proteobacteria bacterium]|nr:sigma-70 family RNA polymerase sigma factor [Pseudomonadota bacterium]
MASPQTPSTSKLRLVTSDGAERAPVEASGPSPDADTVRADVEADSSLTLDNLYRRYAPYVASVASRLLGREAEVEDVVQEVFAAASTGLRRRTSHAEVRGWLATVTVRMSRRQLGRRRFWSWFQLAAEPSYERLAQPGASPEEQRMISELYAVLDNLAVQHRIPWVLRYVEGESLGRIAQLCDCSLATAKRRIAAAHGQIRECMGGLP